SKRIKIIDLGLELAQEILVFNQMFVINGDTKKPIPPFVDQHKLKWFRDPKFRKAVSNAIDRKKIIEMVYPNCAEEAIGFMSRADVRWANTNVPQYKYDVSTAQRLLCEMGLTNRSKDGVLKDAEDKRVEFTLTSGKGNRLRARTAELIRDDLSKVGVKVNLEQIDFERLKWNLNFNSGFECAIFLWSPNGVEPYSESLRSSDLMHFYKSIPPTDWEKRIDALLIMQLGTLDPTTQKKQWDEVQLIMAQ